MFPAIWANQFDNIANRQAHVETTGPEIWDQTGGKVNGFVCAVGSGGTLAGVAMDLGFCAERGQAVPIGAVHARLMRVGNRSLTAIWDRSQLA